MGVASCLSIILEVKCTGVVIWVEKIIRYPDREVVRSSEVNNVLNYTKFHSVP